jgi:putative tricarboxylic transport membrane protein
VRNADRIAAVLLLAFSAAFAAGALKYYKWWGDEGPGPAFMPFWLGLLMALLAGILLVRSLREKAPGAAWLPQGEGLRRMLAVLALTVAFVAALKATGMVLGTALFLGAIVRYLGRHRWWVCGTVAAAAAGFNWLVFVYWLRVPMPAGPLGF